MQHIRVEKGTYKLWLHIRTVPYKGAQVQGCVLNLHHIDDCCGRCPVCSPFPPHQGLLLRRSPSHPRLSRAGNSTSFDSRLRLLSQITRWHAPDLILFVAFLYAYLQVFFLVFICPLNIFYRSSRARLLRVIRNTILAPFYKVGGLTTLFSNVCTSRDSCYLS